MMPVLPLCATAMLLVMAILKTNGQECLQSKSNNGVPPTPRQDGDKYSVIPPGHQAIISSYRFQCYGNITRWRVATNIRNISTCDTNIELQVWRPLGAEANKSGKRLYSKVGANLFTSMSGEEVYIPQRQIEVMPGDVIGFQMFRSTSYCRARSDEHNDRHGQGLVILNRINNTKTNEEVWFAYVGDRVSIGLVSVGYGGVLNKSTAAAPIISASLLRLNNILHTSIPNYDTESTTSMNSTSVTVTLMMREEGNRMNTIIIVVANTTAGILLVAVSITIVVVICICSCRRRAKTRTPLARASKGISETQDERNASFYSEDVVKNVRPRDPMRVKQAYCQVVVQLNQDIQHNDSQLQVNPGPPDFGTNEIELSNSNVDSIITKRNEAYEKFTFINDSGDYENDYCNHQYDYI